MTEKPQPGGADQEQTLLSHLTELRSRLMRSIIAVLVVFAGLAYFSNDIYTIIAEPLLSQLPEDSTMIATEVASPFLVPFKLTIFVAIYIAMPYLLYQAWAFVAPGLYDREQHFVFPLLASSVVLFYLGTAFAYFVVFPVLFGFFTKIAPEGVSVMTDIGHYLDFILKLFFAFGLAFEVPIATILLVKTGIATVESLARMRPYLIVGAFAIGMLLTPPDVFSQTLLALPIWLLFEIGLFCSRYFVTVEPEQAEELHNAE